MKKIKNRADMVKEGFYFLVNGKPWEAKKLPLQKDILEPYRKGIKLKIIRFKMKNGFIQEKVYGKSLAKMLYVYFIGDVPDGYWVVHLDGNIYNNALSNLGITNNKYGAYKMLRKRGIKNEPLQGCNKKGTITGLKEV